MRPCFFATVVYLLFCLLFFTA